jgi:hypothetical protein
LKQNKALSLFLIIAVLLGAVYFAPSLMSSSGVSLPSGLPSLPSFTNNGNGITPVSPSQGGSTTPPSEQLTIKAWWSIKVFYWDGTVKEWTEGEKTFNALDILHEGKKVSHITAEIVNDHPSATNKKLIGAYLVDVQKNKQLQLVPESDFSVTYALFTVEQIQSVIPSDYRVPNGKGDFKLVLSGWLQSQENGKTGNVDMAEVIIPISYAYVSPSTAPVINASPPTQSGTSTPSSGSPIVPNQPQIVKLTFKDYNGQVFYMEAYANSYGDATVYATDLNGVHGWISQSQADQWISRIIPP